MISCRKNKIPRREFSMFFDFALFHTPHTGYFAKFGAGMVVIGKNIVTLKRICAYMNANKVDIRVLAPVLAGFFISGFCDIVAPITGYIAEQFPASPSAVNFLPTMVFLWFLVLSAPVAAMMNRIGRKRMTMAGYAFTFAGLITPYLGGSGASLAWYFAGFCILGLGNTIVQVTVNPLLAAAVPAEKITSYLTVGQIVRNISILMLTPVMALLVAATGSWRLLLPIYGLVTVLGGIWLQMTPIKEEPHHSAASGFGEMLHLLRNPRVLIPVFGIAAFLAADVGIGFLSVRLIDGPNPMLTTSAFYASRIAGTILGAALLLRVSDLKYLAVNMAVALVLSIILIFTANEAAVYVSVALLGFSMACVFATFFATAAKAEPEHSNEVSGLVIMAVSAGAVSGPVCGAIIRHAGAPRWGMVYIALCIVYMLWAALKLNRKTNNKQTLQQ